MKRKILTRKVSFANEKEIEMLLAQDINFTKEKEEKSQYFKTINSTDDEIDEYTRRKSSLVYANKTELLFNTNESIVLFNLFFAEESQAEPKCYDNEEDLINGTNSFIDKKGNCRIYNLTFLYENGKLEAIENYDDIFTPTRD